MKKLWGYVREVWGRLNGIQKLALIGFLALALMLLGWIGGAYGAPQIPGPPERFKDFPAQMGERWGKCEGERRVQIKFFGREATQEFPNTAVYSDQFGEFIWIFYSDKDEDVDARWIVVYTGEAYFQLSMEEIKKLWPSPCDIPRPMAPRQPL